MKSIHITRKQLFPNGTETTVPTVLKNLIESKLDDNEKAQFQTLWAELVAGTRQEITKSDFNV